MDIFDQAVLNGNRGQQQANPQQGQQNLPGGMDSPVSSSQQTAGQTDKTGNQAGDQGTGEADTQQQDGNGADGTEQAAGDETGSDTAGNTQAGTGTYYPGGVNYDSSGRRIIVIGQGSGAQTDQERVGTLDRELEEQMGVFDGMILGRRQDVIAKTNEEGAGQVIMNETGTGEAGDGTTPPLLTSSTNPGNNPNNVITPGQMPNATGDNRQGDYQNSGVSNGAVPSDISDGSDDDIVARQLREAAMQEQDPVLREKLWDEYRKYKQGVQAKQ
jgi:hypothetical protein